MQGVLLKSKPSFWLVCCIVAAVLSPSLCSDVLTTTPSPTTHRDGNPLSFLETLPSLLDFSPTTAAPTTATSKPQGAADLTHNDLLDDPILSEFAENGAEDPDYFDAFTPPDRFTRAILHSSGSANDVVGGGKPGHDFPALSKIPRTGFSCQGKIPGYYADESTACQVFHVCHSAVRKDSFLCPNGTIFHQLRLVCDWWYNVECADSSLHENVNAEFGKVNPRGSDSDSGFRSNNNFNSGGNNLRSQKRTQPRQFGPVVDLPGGTGVTGQTFNLGSHVPAISTRPALPTFDVDYDDYTLEENLQDVGVTTGNNFNAITPATAGSPFLNAFQNRNTLNQVSNSRQRGNFNNIQQTTTVSPFIKAFHNQVSSTPSRSTGNTRTFSNTRTTVSPRRPTQQTFQQTGKPLQLDQGRPIARNQQQSFNTNNLNSISSQFLGKPLSQSRSPNNNFVDSFSPSTATIAPTTVAQQHHRRNQQNQRASSRRPVPTQPATTPRPATTPVRQLLTTIAIPTVTTLRPPVTQRRELLNQIHTSAQPTPARPLSTTRGRVTTSRRNQISSSTGKPLPLKTTVSRPTAGRAGRRGPTLTKVFRTPIGHSSTTPLKPVLRGNAIAQSGPFSVKLDDSNELDDISDEILINTSNLGAVTPQRPVQTLRNRKKLTSGRNRISIGSPVSVPQILSPIANRNRNRVNTRARNKITTSSPISTQRQTTSRNSVQNQVGQAFGVSIDATSGPGQTANNNNLGGFSQVAIAPSAGVLSTDLIRQQQEKRARENKLRKQKLQQAFQQQKINDAQKKKRPVPRLPFPVPNNAVLIPNIAGARPISAGRPLSATNVRNNNRVTQPPQRVTTSVSVPAQRFKPPPLAIPVQQNQNSVQQLHNRRAQQNQQRQQLQQQQAFNQLNQNIQQNRQSFNNQQQRINRLQEQQILRQQQNIERQNHNIEIQQQRERNQQNSLNNRQRVQNTRNNVGGNRFRVVLDDDFDDDFDDRFDGDDHFDDDRFDDDLNDPFDDDRFDLDDRFDDDRFDLDDRFDDDRFDDDRFDDDRFDLDDPFDDDRFDLDDRFDDLDDDLDDRFDDDRIRNRPTTRFNRQSGNGLVVKAAKSSESGKVAPPSEIFLPPPPLLNT